MERKILKIGALPADERPYGSPAEARSTAGGVHLPVSIGSRPSTDESSALFDRLPSEEVRLDANSRLLFHTDPHSSASDRYRLLRLRLREFKAKLKLKTILVTSPNPGDGKSTTVINLATALTEQGRSRVLVIEADLYHAPLIELLGMKASEGLGENLERALNPFAGIRRLDPLGWYLLPAGKASISPTELLSKDALLQTIRKLAPYFDWVLIDSPPVIPLTDTLLLKSCSDVTLLIARAGHTSQKDIQTCISLIGPEHVLGIVLNAAEDINHMYSKYSKYYGYYSRQANSVAK